MVYKPKLQSNNIQYNTILYEGELYTRYTSLCISWIQYIMRRHYTEVTIKCAI